MSGDCAASNRSREKPTMKIAAVVAGFSLRFDKGSLDTVCDVPGRVNFK
jgi:hypothetical protein